MKIKITTSRDHLMWYHNLIGSEWIVIKKDEECYYFRDNENKLNIIYKCDTTT